MDASIFRLTVVARIESVKFAGPAYKSRGGFSWSGIRPHLKHGAGRQASGRVRDKRRLLPKAQDRFLFPLGALKGKVLDLLQDFIHDQTRGRRIGFAQDQGELIASITDKEIGRANTGDQDNRKWPFNT